jgi:transcription elongation factor Elf1
MNKKKKVLDVLTTVLGNDYREVNKGEHLFHCKFCGHHKKKLSVNLDPSKQEFGFYKCWVCKESGKSLFTLLKKLNAPSHLFKKLSKALDRPSYGGNKDKPSSSVDVLSLPEEYKPMWKEHPGYEWNYAYNYLQRRGITRGDMIKYKIGWCKEGKYQHRIIIPSYDEDGDLNYFTGRDFFGSSSLKYLNPKTSRNVIIFDSLIDWSEPLTIVEGVFDAMACRRNATCLMSKKIHSRLLNKILLTNPPHINLMLDGDAFEAGVEISEKLMNQGQDVRLVRLEDKDPADLGFSGSWKRMKNESSLDFEELIKHKVSL